MPTDAVARARESPLTIRRRMGLLLLLWMRGLGLALALAVVGERLRWAIAYPDGFRRHWNSGPCCGRGRDVPFFDALLRDLARRGLPAHRVAVVGFSDGGFFAHRLACQRTRRLRAVAAVATTMIFRPCRPSRPLPVTSISMERDRRLPLTGRGDWPGVADVSRFWRRANRCRLRSTGETTLWTVERGRRCTAPYAAYVIRSAGHGWPAPAGDLVAEAIAAA